MKVRGNSPDMHACMAWTGREGVEWLVNGFGLPSAAMSAAGARRRGETWAKRERKMKREIWRGIVGEGRMRGGETCLLGAEMYSILFYSRV